MPEFHCAITGCDRTKHEAKGLCRYHYKQTRPRTPDRKVTLACQGCGTRVQKDKRTPRYLTVQCGSQLCRHWLNWGAWSSPLPKDHPALGPKPVRATAKTKPLTYREFECAWCGHASSTMYDTTRFCSVACKLKAKASRRRGREHGAEGTYTWAQIAKLWTSFGHACAYCRTPTPLTEVQPEHVTPLSRGGRNDLSNLLPSCLHCNADKRDLLLPEWTEDRARRSLPAVTTTWSPTDPRYRHLVLPIRLAA